MRDLVFATVGTDHHPFDRLVMWMDGWAGTPAAAGVRCLVQSGTSVTPEHVPFRDYVRYDEMCEAMSRAVAVVAHGGPATIMDARRLGRVPIVVPRSADLGEHVDNHQQRFARRMAELGQIHLAGSADELYALLERAIADPDTFSVVTSGDEIVAACTRFSDMVDELVNAPRKRRRLTRSRP